jgi:hypothetical protein
MYPEPPILRHTTPLIIMHDQESLFYNFYDSIEISNKRNEILSRKSEKKGIDYIMSDEMIEKYWKKVHLRTSLPPSLFPVTIVHSELRSSEVRKYHDHGYLTCYYWAHGLIARDWYRFAQYDLKLNYNFENIKYDFLIYNRSWTGIREYRLKFSEMLLNAKLTSLCKTSFSPQCDGVSYLEHPFRNKNFCIQRKDLEQHFINNSSLATASADYCNDDYNMIAIEVVLETVFDDDRWHLTEKILRPIACGKPFLLVSTPGSLEYLKNYGFQTFSPWLNEDYDSTVDPLERLNKIITEIKRIQNLSRAEKKELFNKLHGIAEYNKQRFFSEGFGKKIISEFVKNMNTCLDQCNQQISLDSINERIKLGQKYQSNIYHDLSDWYEQIKLIFKNFSK